MNKSRQRSLITGVNGFVGMHLARTLHESGFLVVGIGREAQPADRVAPYLDSYLSADLAKAMPKTVPAVDHVIHLAGMAAVGPSFNHPQQYIQTNSSIFTNLCEYFLGFDSKPRIIAVSSGAIYDSSRKMPIDEDSALNYNSPYVVSKVLNENQCAYYRQRGLDCIVARPFNHIGAGQATGFILPDLYDRLSNLSEKESLIVGNLNTRRDYTDVRDIAQAYMLLATAKELRHDTYNVCSGSSMSGREILDILLRVTGKTAISIEVDDSLIRPTDIMDIRGDSSRLRRELAWSPRHNIEQTIEDFVNYSSAH